MESASDSQTTTLPPPKTPETGSSSSSTPPLPKPSPSNSRIRQLRLLLLSRLTKSANTSDILLLRLSRLLSDPTGIDSLLSTLGYTLQFISALLSRLLQRRLTILATSIASKASDALLPGETLIASLPAPTSTRLLAQSTASAKALSDVISDYRIFVRLWSMAGIYTWGRGLWTSPLPPEARGREKVLRGISWAQVGACAAYQVLENGAYLASKGVLTSAGWSGEQGKKREVWWWVWSSRFWAAHVALELARLGGLWYWRRKEDKAGAGGVDDGEKEEKLRMEEMRKEDEAWWRDLVSNVAYAPLTVHWSMEEGFISETWVGALGAVAGAVGLREAWRNTA